MLGWGTGELPGAHCLKPHFSGAPFSGAPFLAPEPNGPKTTEEIPLARSELSLLRPECICGHPCIRLIAHPLPTPLRSGLGTTRARVSVCEGTPGLACFELSAPACAFLSRALSSARLLVHSFSSAHPAQAAFIASWRAYPREPIVFLQATIIASLRAYLQEPIVFLQATIIAIHGCASLYL